MSQYLMGVLHVFKRPGGPPDPHIFDENLEILILPPLVLGLQVCASMPGWMQCGWSQSSLCVRQALYQQSYTVSSTPNF